MRTYISTIVDIHVSLLTKAIKVFQTLLYNSRYSCQYIDKIDQLFDEFNSIQSLDTVNIGVLLPCST